MLNICSLFQGFFGFIKNINKKAYRTQAMIVSGSVLVAVVSFGAKDFGGSGRNAAKTGKNSFEAVEANTEKDETDDMIDETGASLLPIEREIVGLGSIQQNLAQDEELTINDLRFNAEKETMLEPVEVIEEQEEQEKLQEEVQEELEEIQSGENETIQEDVVEVVTETEVIQSGCGIELSDDDYYWLTKIVEAEAGDQDDIGKILVVNVIFNRVRSTSFPNSVKQVIFQNNGKTYQFEPVKTGIIYDKQPSNNTLECINRAIDGEDYSQGALFFTMRTSSGSWFNTSLNLLFVHGDHYFYTYY